MSTANFPYKEGQLIEVQVYNPSISRCEWLSGIVTGPVDRDDKEYGVAITLHDGRKVGTPYGAAPECVRPLS